MWTDKVIDGATHSVGTIFSVGVKRMSLSLSYVDAFLDHIYGMLVCHFNWNEMERKMSFKPIFKNNIQNNNVNLEKISHFQTGNGMMLRGIGSTAAIETVSSSSNSFWVARGWYQRFSYWFAFDQSLFEVWRAFDLTATICEEQTPLRQLLREQTFECRSSVHGKR